jgi:acyl dehydratase
MLVFATVFGLSVEDFSEAGGLFLGVDNLTFHRTVYPGQTLTARSTVREIRESQSRPNAGIVTWHTEGFLADGDDDRPLVVDFRRSNLVPKRGGAGASE